MEQQVTGANEPVVAEPVNNPAEDTAVKTEPIKEDGAATKGEVAPPNPKQSAEDNSKFAKMRREMEASSKRVAELEKQLADHDKLTGTIGDLYGYKGTPAQVRDMLIANDRGISVEQLNAERAAEEAKKRSLVENDPEYKRAIEENKHLQDVLVQDRMAKDLQLLKAEYPDLKAETVDDLGEDYAKLIGLGWSAKEAYEGSLARTRANMKTPPPSTGPVKSNLPADKEFYTSEEVDHITREDLQKDPTLIDKIKRSMARW